MQLIGLGLYTFPQAARLTGIPSVELHRWLQGYGSESDGVRQHPPLWESELADADVTVLSFHDLLEVRFVKEFRKHGVSLQTIRVVAQNAREMFDTPYPFTCRRFETDGVTIFASAFDENEDGEMIDLRKRQYAFKRIIRPSLYAGIEFGADQRASRWYPLERSRSVVIDPNIAFGKPVVAETAVRTDVLHDAWLAEGKDKKRVARLYAVPVNAVDAAIRYETRLAA